MSGYTRTFAEADPDDVDRLGGKGSGLARMTQQGLRVPPGYIVSTAACREYLTAKRLPDGLADEVMTQLAALERRSGKTFGVGPRPLLLSVRSGAPVSMPGMMDTILNLGLGRAAAIALAEATGDTRFMADLVARFHAMYGDTVFGALGGDSTVDDLVAATKPGDDPGSVYDRVWAAAEAALADDTGDSVPADPRAQLLGAVEAVFRSWNTRRARTYREFHGIPHDLGTAVVVQSMVFGNQSDDSGSGVVFTRDPVTGEPGLYGEYLAHSQGEDVVAGVRTPDKVVDALPPALLAQLRATCAELESRLGDVLDIEFTVERSVLYFLQVRKAKRTPEAAVRIAADLLADGKITVAGALAAVSPEQVRQVQRPGFDADEVATARADGRLLTSGIGACPGQVSGVLVLDPDRAKRRADAGERVVLARRITSPADLHGMIAAAGIVTATGGATSHAAVVARALGTACVVGARDLDVRADVVVFGGRELAEGASVSLDGGSGELFTGAFATATPAAATGALDSLLAVARDAAGCAVLGRVTRQSDVDSVVAAGAVGLVAAVDDVLAATGHLETLLESDFDHVADVIATEFAPLLAAAGGREFGVRAVDFLADESRELVRQTALTARYPELSVPLGRPELIRAQVDGLARAARDSGAAAHLALRHVTDPAEAAELRSLAGDALAVGAYLTSPRAVFNASGIAAAVDALWVDVRALQAAAFGIPARHLLTAEPLDDYLRRGLLSTDPRVTIDKSVDVLLAKVAAVTGECAVGLRLTGDVSVQAAGRLHELGFRRFAVDAAQVRPVQVALGRAATG